MMLFYVFSILFFANGLCACPRDVHTNLQNLIDLKLTRHKMLWYHNELKISSKEVTILIQVEVAILFAHLNESVSVDELTCRDDKSQHLVMTNHFFFYKTIKQCSLKNVFYRFISTQKLLTPRVTNGEWDWVCKLSTLWGGHSIKKYDFRIKVIDNQNKTNASTREAPVYDEYEGPAEPKQLTSGPKDTDIPISAFFVGGCDSESPTWVTVLAVSVSMFVMGLVIGALCRRPRARELEPKQADDQTDEHDYDEVVARDINNRPPLPVPERTEYIYNSPYDHTLRFQHEMRLQSQNRNQ